VDQNEEAWSDEHRLMLVTTGQRVLGIGIRRTLYLELQIRAEPDCSVAGIWTEESAWLGGTGDGSEARAVVAQLSATCNRTESCRAA
jgi:hypothetical protein